MAFLNNFKLLFAIWIMAVGIVAPSEGQNPPTNEDCTGPAPFPDPASCSSYYQCFIFDTDTGYVLVHFDCPPGGIWMDGVCVEGTCEEPTTTSMPTTSTPPPSPTTSPAPVMVECNTKEASSYPGSCTKYYNCMLLEGSFVHYVFECQPGSYFNPTTQLCTLGECPSEDATPATTPTTKARSGAKAGSALLAVNPCPSEGLFPDVNDCTAYYQCVRENGRIYQYNYRCQTGAYWSTTYNGCVVGTCPIIPPA